MEAIDKRVREVRHPKMTKNNKYNGETAHNINIRFPL